MGTGDGVSLIQLAHSDACTHSVHTRTAHTICGVLRLNNLLPKAYLFLSSYNTNTQQALSHTRPYSSPRLSGENEIFSSDMHTHSKKNEEMPQSNSYPFLCKNCPCSVGSYIKVTWSDDTHTHWHNEGASVTEI